MNHIGLGFLMYGVYCIIYRGYRQLSCYVDREDNGYHIAAVAVPSLFPSPYRKGRVSQWSYD